MKIIAILIGLNLFITPFSLKAQYNNQLSGRVLDAEDDSPIPGAALLILGINRGVVTDLNGRFTMPNIPSGRIKLQVSFLGYATQVRDINLQQAPEELTIRLEPSTININEVVVSGALITEKEKTPIAIETMGARQIAQSGGTTLIDAIALIPGVEQISMGTGIGKPVIRGLSFSRILTIIQGSRFENMMWGEDHGIGQTDYGIQKVEVIKGPASLSYGSGAVGGVVNLIDETMPEPGNIEGDYNLNLFSNTLGIRSNLGIKGSTEDGFFWRVRGGVENHADYLTGENVAVGNSRFNTQTLKGSAGVNKNWGTSKLTYTYHHQNLGIIEENENIETLATTRNDRSMQLPFQDVTDHMISSENSFFINRSRIRLNLSYHTNIREEIEDDFEEVDLGLIQRNLTWDLKYNFPQIGNAEYVIGIQGFRLSNRNYEDAGEILIPDAVMLDNSIFGLINFDWDRVTLQGGARYDHRRTRADARGENFLEYGYELPGQPESRQYERDFSGFSGSLGFLFRANKDLLFRTNLASGFRAPDLAELFSNGIHPGTSRFEMGNANFDREQNIQYDVSGLYNNKNFSLELSGFVNYVWDYVFFRPTGVEVANGLFIWEFEQDHVRLIGGEAGIEFHPVALPWFRVKSTYASVYGRNRETGEHLPLIPPVRFTHQANFNLPQLGLIRRPFINLRLQNVLRQDRVASDELVTPGYNLINLGFGGNIAFRRQQIECNLTVNNLLNYSYFNHLSLVRAFDILSMGRNVVLNVRIPFNL
ncbi:TonB-dependent receptor [soil metagenome]